MNVQERVHEGGNQFRVKVSGYHDNPNDTIGLLIDYIEKFNECEKLVFEFPDEVFVFRTENELEQFINGFDFFFDKHN